MFIHLDLDAFFINATRTINPSLKGVSAATISGGKKDIFGDFLPPGMVLSASYEARAKGIKCGTSAKNALKIDPDIKLVATDFKLYKKLSNALYEVLYSYTDEIEKYSIDEFFMDLKGSRYEKEPLKLAKIIQKRVLSELDLPSSLGIAPHKWWAKLATSLAKPFGIRQILSFDELCDIHIKDFAGVGKASYAKLEKYGITKLGEVKDAKQIFETLGKNGLSLYERICGLGGDELRKNEPVKSCAIARTFGPICNRFELNRRIKILCNYLHFELSQKHLSPKKLELKFAYQGSQASSHTLSLEGELSNAYLIKSAQSLFARHDSSVTSSVIYLSIGASDFESDTGLFWQEASKKQKALDKALEKLREKYDENII